MAVDDAYTKSLLHLDGADESTDIVDESGKEWTAANDAKLDTTQKKFGTASLELVSNGDWVTTPWHTDWAMPGAFTLDMQVRWRSNPAQTIFWENYDGGLRYLIFYLSTTSNLRLYCYASAARLDVNFAWSPVKDTDYHLEISRDDSSDIRAFVNGTQIGSTENDSYYPVSVDGSIYVGGGTHISTASIDGWIDEFRHSKDIARHTSNFTPPTAPYSAPTLSYPIHTDGNALFPFG